MEDGSTSQNPENPDHSIFPVGDFWVGKDGKWRVLRNGTLSLIPNINHSSISDSQRVAPTHSRPEEYRVCINPEEDSVCMNPEENTRSVMKSFDRAPGSSRTAKSSSSNSVFSWADPISNTLIHAQEASGSMDRFLKSATNLQNISADNLAMTRGQGSVSDTQNRGQERFQRFLNYEDEYAYGGYAPKNLAGSSFSNSRTNSLKSHSSTSNFRNDEIQLVMNSYGSCLKDALRYRMYSYFERLLDRLKDIYLDEVIQDILSEYEPFMNAVFFPDGSKAIVKMIKKMAHLDLASTATAILSTRFYEIMTDDNASLVILQCFTSFIDEANEILYVKLKDEFQNLAIHGVGCRSLNKCIDKISENRRMDLADAIADISKVLAYHQYGTYVVQHVIRLKKNSATTKILNCLKGKFVSLSKLSKGKSGSYVVQNLIESSGYGTAVVVKEILLENQESLLTIACHPFGTYVIQKALERTRTSEHTELHKSLVEALEPYRRQLKKSEVGKYVLNKL